MADGSPPDPGRTLPPLIEGPARSPRTLVSPGDVLDQRFKVVRIIARGGMGVVAEAEDRALQTRVALKFIDPGLADHPAAQERFRREILLSRRITHRNVCRIFDLFSAQLNGNAVLFFTMEYLEGETLSARLRAGPLDPP